MPQWVLDDSGRPIYVDPATGEPVSPFGSPTAGLTPAALYDLAAGGVVSREPAAVPAEGTLPAVPVEPAPAEFAPAAPAPATIPATAPGFRAGVSTSESGFQPERFAAVQKTEKGVRGRMTAADQAAQAQVAPFASALERAQQARLAASQASTAAEMAKIQAEGTASTRLSAAATAFADEEKAAEARAQAGLATYRAKYENQLAEFRAARVDPGQLLNSMTPGENLGTIASVFVHGFLGAKGIRTDTMDILNRAIDRNIAAQEEGIRRKGQAAGMFKDLWDMQRAESATDAEARMRVRGFMMQSLKDSIASELAGYDSDLARTRGAEALALLDQQLVKDTNALYQQAADNAYRNKNLELDLYGKQLQASLAKQQQAIELAKLGLQKGAQKDALRELVVRDTTGAVLGRADTKEQKVDLDTRIGAVTNMNKRLVELQEMMRNEGRVYSGTGAKLFVDKNKAQLRSLYNDLVSTINRAQNGARASDKDAERIEKTLPFDDFSLGLATGQLPAESVAAAFGVRSIEDLTREATAQLQPVPADVAEAYRGGLNQEILPGELAAQRIVAEGFDHPTTDHVDAAAARITGPGAQRASDAASVGAAKADLEASGALGVPYGGGAFQSQVISPPDWAAGMAELRRIAETPTTSPAERTHAIQELTKWASELPGVTDPLAQQQSALAQYELLQLVNAGGLSAVEASEGLGRASGTREE